MALVVWSKFTIAGKVSLVRLSDGWPILVSKDWLSLCPQSLPCTLT